MSKNEANFTYYLRFVRKPFVSFLVVVAVDLKVNSDSKGSSSLYNPIIFPILIRDTRFLK